MKLKRVMDSSIPTEIEQAINNASEAMQTHAQHLLLPIYRYAIYESIDKTAGLNAHRVKVSLGILTVQHVLPYWRMPLFMYSEDEEEFEYWQHIPRHMLEMAIGVINGTIERNKALSKASHWQEVTDLSGQLQDSPYYNEWCVFDAGQCCLWQALNSDAKHDIEVDIDTRDDDLPFDFDVAKWACLAYTGGTWTPNNPTQWSYDKQQDRWITRNRGWYFEDNGIWNRDTKIAITRRQAFWEWWLTQAVGSAWSEPVPFWWTER